MRAERGIQRRSYAEALRTYYDSIIQMLDVLTSVEDCEVFPREYLEQCVNESEQERKEVERYREQLSLQGGYNIVSEKPVYLVGCRLENGRIIGSSLESALQYAKKWVEEFPLEGTDCTMYEMGAYLLALHNAHIA